MVESSETAEQLAIRGAEKQLRKTTIRQVKLLVKKTGITVWRYKGINELLEELLKIS